MPHVHVTVTGKHTRQWKQELMDFAAATIHANTSTPLKNVYVYIHEMDPENKLEISILINDFPLACGMLGGISRADNCDW